MTGERVAPGYGVGRNPTGQEDSLAGLKRHMLTDSELPRQDHIPAYQKDFPLFGPLLNYIPVLGPAINSASNAIGSAVQSGASTIAGLVGNIPIFGGLLGSVANNFGSLVGQFLTGNDILTLPILGGLGLGGFTILIS